LKGNSRRSYAKGDPISAFIRHQIDRALGAITWSPEEIKAYQKRTGVVSVKKSMRPGGDPTRPLPVIFGIGTRKSYYDAAGLFFIRAKTLSGHNLLAKLLDTEIIRSTFDRFYFASAPGTLKKILAAINKVFLAARSLAGPGWKAR
jgi:hypothetical protein